MEIGLVILGIFVGFAVGFLLAKYRSQPDDISNNPLVLQLKKNIEEREDELRILRSENLESSTRLAASQENIITLERDLKNQVDQLNNLQEKFNTEFENLANKILEEKSKKFTDQNKENLNNILSPLKEKIQLFEEKVDKTYREEGKERASLKKELEQLMLLNHQLSKDANNLALALKGDSKTQGDWGEYRLEMILEKAGLINGVHFQTQSTFRDEEGAMKRPDFIINLPEDKHLIIDSKVSLTAYEQYVSANDEDKGPFLKAHLDSIRQHIRGLGQKNYQNLYDIQTPDYVLMYVPIEPAFNIAAHTDDKLFLEALDRNIVIVTTSTLLATMKTVSFIWKQEDQKKNVVEIAKQGAALYDKFVGFTDNLIKIGNQMQTAKNTYDEAMKQLSTGKGNLVKRAKDMKSLGLETSKSMNAVLEDRSISEDHSK